MKNFWIVLCWLTFIAMIVKNTVHGEIVYQTTRKSEADIVVYVTTLKSEATKVITVSTNPQDAKKKDHWVFTNLPSKASIRVYYTTRKSEAKEIVYFIYRR